MPERQKYFDRPGRFGAHNILEHIPSEGPWANIVFLTYFSAGLRAVDVSDPLQPKEVGCYVPALPKGQESIRSEEHTSELQSLMRISYAVFCLKKKNIKNKKKI